MEFGRNRAEHYDKLFWARDDGYLDAIIKAADFTKDDLVLDVGTGTGIVAKKIVPLVTKMFALDISHEMLKKGSWEGISIVHWDIRNPLFASGVFDKITARMVFHHITEGLDQAVQRCHSALRDGGRLIVAEGVPPLDDNETIDWYTDMFSLKEDRITFTRDDLVKHLTDNGFKDVADYEYITKGFSIRNWLENSGIESHRQDAIMKLHYSASDRIKEAYDMQITRDDCIVNTKNIIFIATK